MTWCIGKDTTGAFSQVVSLYNQSHPGVHVKLLELPTSADQQRTQLTQRLQAKSSECDVLGMDVIWTAEFASQGWLKDVTPAIQARQNEFIPSTLNTAKINGKYWAVPFNTNAGLLYYNDKKVSQAPTTWQQVLQMAKTDGGFGFQGQAYEGLTVDFLEMLYSAGGSVLSPDGKSATIDSSQAQQVLSFLQQGMKDKAIPQANLTYMEEESRNAFQDGRVSILRNWPYVYSLAKAAKVPFKVEPLPTWQGGKAASVLGGYNLGISTYSKNPGGGVELHQLRHRSGGAEEVLHQVVAAGGPHPDLQGPGSGEVAAVRPAAAQGSSERRAAAGVAGVSADQRGDLQERVLGAVERHGAVDRAEERAESDQLGPEDVLGQHHGDDRRGNVRQTAQTPSLGSLRAAAGRGDGFAVADRDR